MHIALLHNFVDPNPDYQNMASGLRALNHTVWLGTPSNDGYFQWHDGERVVAVLSGPSRMLKNYFRIPLLGMLLKRLSFLGFMIRIRNFLRYYRPDIVQMDPGPFLFPWLLSLFMPRQMHFVFDIKQINVGWRSGLIGKLKDWQLLLSWWLCARFFFHHTCFDHELAAHRILGARWSEWATVVPVGLNPNLLSVNRSESGNRYHESRVRFIYVGAISKSRNLERILYASIRVLSFSNKFEVVFVGPDSSEGQFQKLITELNLSSHILVEPPVPYDSIPELLKNFDVGLAYVPARPTWNYQPTIKVLEYRALGLAILSTDVVSHHEIVDEGVNGLFTDNTVESLSQAMLRFVQDYYFLQHCKKNAKNMRRGITISEVARMHEQVYIRLANASH